MATVFLTGANRGLGLEFRRQYAADGSNVLAAVRRPKKANVFGPMRVTEALLKRVAATPNKLQESLSVTMA